MDYETADGSQFSLREVVTDEGDSSTCQYTLITAFVDGNAYAGKSVQRMEDMDDMDVMQHLQPVPLENIFPKLPKDFTLAPPFNASEHYLKAPQFTYDDVLPGNGFVADVLLSEAQVLERLRKQPHPSIATYYGVVTKNDRITHLCLKRYNCSLTEYLDSGLSVADCERILLDVRDGIDYLHSLGLAHNDITPDNICIDTSGHAVLVDFDSCVPFGEALKKGQVKRSVKDQPLPVSARENDYDGFADVEFFLLPPEEAHDDYIPTAWDELHT